MSYCCVSNRNFTSSLISAAQVGYVCNYFCRKTSPYLWTGWGAGAQKDAIEKIYILIPVGVTQREHRKTVCCISSTITNHDLLTPCGSLHIHARNQNRLLLDMP